MKIVHDLKLEIMNALWPNTVLHDLDMFEEKRKKVEKEIERLIIEKFQEEVKKENEWFSINEDNEGKKYIPEILVLKLPEELYEQIYEIITNDREYNLD
ncbi:MAG: hypothetical protein ACOC85_04135 [Thermoplasmatota archaeon]